MAIYEKLLANSAHADRFLKDNRQSVADTLARIFPNVRKHPHQFPLKANYWLLSTTKCFQLELSQADFAILIGGTSNMNRETLICFMLKSSRFTV